jgi:hypothetical protein
MLAKDYGICLPILENTINDTVYLHFLLFPKPNIFSYVCQVQEPVSATPFKGIVPRDKGFYFLYMRGWFLQFFFGFLVDE